MAERIATELDVNVISASGMDNDICILHKCLMIEYDAGISEWGALYACYEISDRKVGILNLHLPWDSALAREEAIIKIIEKLKDKKADYIFMLGDFNCGDNSDVIRMLMGDCSFHGIEANPCFYDLALASAQINGTTVHNTLNFRKNPRFVTNTIEINQRFDRILLRNTYPVAFPYLRECNIFGTKVYEENKLAASDHYGVFAQLDF
jgi:endonuclease/exonuclease/phosphatase family metal-dependent hydrolase